MKQISGTSDAVVVVLVDVMVEGISVKAGVMSSRIISNN